MRKSTTFSFLLLLFLHVSAAFAQEAAESAEALFREIDRYLYSPGHERKQSKEYHKKLKELSESGNARALHYLGLLQKDGIGTQSSLKKSLRSFRRAFELGNQESAYCVGYYYLKGFGEVKQHYGKAYKWFEKSGTPMAMHWMAKMQYLGLGREANKQKSLEMLEGNDLYNSKVLLKQLKINGNPSEGSSQFKGLLVDFGSEGLHGLNGLQRFPEANSLKGTWEGEYFELDWSKKKIFRVLPITLEMSNENGVVPSIRTSLKIGDSVTTNIGSYSAGHLKFPDMVLPIKKKYTDYPNFTYLINEIKGIELRRLRYNGENLIIGRLNSFHPLWREPSNPTFIVLKKKIEINADALAAFKEQTSDFLKVYPNPLQEYFLVNFELPHESNIRLDIKNYYGTGSYQQTVYEGRKTAGTHTLEILNPPSSPGNYLLTIRFNGNTENKILIKK